MPISGGQYAVTATATSVAAALGLTDSGDPVICNRVIIQYNEDGTADAFLGSSGVTTVPVNCYFKFTLVAANIPRIIFDVSSSSASHGIDLRQIFLIGTANAANLFFITIVY